MKNIFLATAILLSFLNCAKNNQQDSKLMWVCNCQEQATAAKWIGDHLEAANNKSDEEMEDVIYQMQKTAVQLHCKQRMVTGYFDNNWHLLSTQTDSCFTTFNY